jgi:hypothetical protein
MYIFVSDFVIHEFVSQMVEYFIYWGQVLGNLEILV